MEREDRGRQPRAWDGESAQDEADEERRQGMEEDRDEVVPKRRVAPEPMLQPEGGVDDRVVLLGRARLEPDAAEAVERTEGGRGEVLLVVPEQSAVPGGVVGGERDDDEREKKCMSRRRPAAAVRPASEAAALRFRLLIAGGYSTCECQCTPNAGAVNDQICRF
jgi:hypothetical protein